MASNGSTDDHNQRMMWLWANLVGHVVSVTTCDESIWEGLFQSKEPETLHIVLSQARLRASRVKGEREKCDPREILKISATDVIAVRAVDAPLAAPVVQSANYGHADQAGQERDMVAWRPDGGDKYGDLEGGGELESGNNGGKWDQFAENKRLHGVVSTYDENFYTTELDKNKFTDEQKKHASRMADEIARGGGGDHDAEKWADDYDEEAMHSCVTRESDEITMNQYNKSQYVPPHMRARGAGPAPPVTAHQPESVAQQPQPEFHPHQQVQQHQPQHPQQQQQQQQQQQHQQQQQQQQQYPSRLQMRNDNGAPALPIPMDCYQGQSTASQLPNMPATADVPTAQPPQQQQQPPQQPQQTAAAPVQESTTTTASTQARGLPPTRATARGKPGAKPEGSKEPLTRAQTIASFLEFSKKDLSKGKEKEAAADDGTPQRRLNPSAQPYVPGVSGEPEPEEKEPEAPVVEEEVNVEPKWEVQLSSKATNTKFIARIIAEGICSRIKQKSTPLKTIPGDPEVFKHEWSGENFYWDEEYEEKLTESNFPASQQGQGQTFNVYPTQGGQPQDQRYSQQGGYAPPQQQPQGQYQQQGQNPNWQGGSQPNNYQQQGGYQQQQPPPQQQQQQQHQQQQGGWGPPTQQNVPQQGNQQGYYNQQHPHQGHPNQNQHQNHPQQQQQPPPQGQQQQQQPPPQQQQQPQQHSYQHQQQQQQPPPHQHHHHQHHHHPQQQQQQQQPQQQQPPPQHGNSGYYNQQQQQPPPSQQGGQPRQYNQSYPPNNNQHNQGGYAPNMQPPINQYQQEPNNSQQMPMQPAPSHQGPMQPQRAMGGYNQPPPSQPYGQPQDQQQGQWDQSQYRRPPVRNPGQR